MKKLILSLFLCVTAMGAAAQSMYGDVNGDNVVNITDVNHVIDIILSGGYDTVADVNSDGQVNITDLNVIIELILNPPVEPPVDEGDWVDLGLPSGTIWATRNIGASAPEDFGSYFAWGETSPKEVYNLDTYKWYIDSNNYTGFTKYCIYLNGYDGYIDNKTELDPNDDAATVNWGMSSYMPSLEQMEELVNECSWTSMSRNGVNGTLGTGRNGNTIFFPAAGCFSKSSLHFVGKYGFYWSRTLITNLNVACLDVQANYAGTHSDYRFFGFTVRAVR